MKKKSKICSVLIFIVALVGCSESEVLETATTAVAESEQRDGVDWILTNGKILTADNDFSIVEAMAIKDGRIVAVGNDADVMSYANAETELTDLAGQTIVPGLIDNHMHFVRATKQWHRQVRWDGMHSREQALQLLKERSDNLPEGEWAIVVGSFIMEQFHDNEAPFTAAELDAYIPDRPVYIQEAYTRAFVNTAAMHEADITTNSTVNQRGELIKDEVGDLTGELTGTAMNLAMRSIPVVNNAVWDASVGLTVQSLLGMGLTAVYDVGGATVTPAFYESIKRVADADDLDMRVFYTLNPQNSPAGSAEEIIAQMQSNTPDNEGLQFARFGYGETVYRPMRANPFEISDEDKQNFKNILIAAVENGWQINEHTTQDLKAQTMLDVVAEVAETHPQVLDMRFTIDHTNGISEETIERAKTLGMVFATHSSSRNLTPARFEFGVTQPPIKTINELDGIWGLGSDSTTSNSPNPFHTIAWVVTGHSASGKQTFFETTSREDALVAHTRTNGYILFREDHIGSLEVGKLADFAVLNDDYMTVPAEQIKDLHSVMTVVEGKVVYTAQQFYLPEFVTVKKVSKRHANFVNLYSELDQTTKKILLSCGWFTKKHRYMEQNIITYSDGGQELLKNQQRRLT